LLAEVFRTELSQFTPTTQASEIPDWDSLGQLDLMLALEAEFGVRFPLETLAGARSVPALEAALSAALGAEAKA
jgi:acyl carrier protein